MLKLATEIGRIETKGTALLREENIFPDKVFPLLTENIKQDLKVIIRKKDEETQREKKNN